jgi:hypothetical protein
MLVKKLYIVFVSAMGLWLGNYVGSPFLYNSTVRFVF